LELPETEVIADEIFPPVQLSATDKVFFWAIRISPIS